jgi:hypothetical protein
MAETEMGWQGALGQALGGFAAGYQGQAAGYMTGLAEQNARAEEQRLEAEKLARLNVMAQTPTALQYAKEGNYEQIVALVRDTDLSALPEDTRTNIENLSKMATAAAAGDEASAKLLERSLEGSVRTAIDLGIVKGPQVKIKDGGAYTTDRGTGKTTFEPIAGAPAGEGNRNQFSADRFLVQDSKGNRFTQTDLRNPNAAEGEAPVRSVLTPFDPNQAAQKPEGTLTVLEKLSGMTPGEKVSQAGAIAAVQGAAQVGTQRALTEILADQKRGVELAKGEADRVTEAVNDGLTAVRQLPDLKRGLELLQTVETSGLESNIKQVTDYLGETPADVGELNRILSQRVLDSFSYFKGALSDRENAFVKEIETNLKQSKGTNIAILNNAMKQAQNRLQEGYIAAQAAGADTYTLDRYTRAMERLGMTGKAPGAASPPKVKFLGFEGG